MLDGDYIGFLTEYMPDGNLFRWIEKRRNGCDIESCKKLIIEILRGVEHIHDKKLVHRDLKPENILLETGIPKITDFGVSRIVNEGNPRSTSQLGSPAYSSPEALREENIQPTDDLWSVGVILYELLSGGPLYTSLDGVDAYKQAILNFVPPESNLSGIPSALRDIVFRAVSKEKSDRFQSAPEMIEALAGRSARSAPKVRPPERATEPDKGRSSTPDRVENLRGGAIVHICYPKQKVIANAPYSDSTRDIRYEFVTVEIAKDLILGYLFLKKTANATNTFQHFLDGLSVKLSKLTICTPRVINPETGKEVNRLANIEDRFLDFAPRDLFERTEYSYIDDLVWARCLNDQLKMSVGEVAVEKNFVDQELFQLRDISGEGAAENEGLSLRYLQHLLNSPEKEQPANIILGRAGVGKSTLCEKLVSIVNQIDRKRALFISSTDLKIAWSDRPNNGWSDEPIETLTDLYRLYVKTTDVKSSDILEPENLEINISCGNIVLIIDGLDEIESILKDRFNLDTFIDSAIALNDAYRSCSIIITSRDYYEDRYSGRDSVRIFRLLGFTDEMVENYLNKRSLPKEKFGEAKSRLKEFESVGNRYTPLYLSLICDLIIRREAGIGSSPPIKESTYFYSNLPLDNLLYELLEREINNQSLTITCDDYYGILEEIAVKSPGYISKEVLNAYIELLENVKAASRNPKKKFPQFYPSPLLQYDESLDRFSIKYDFVELWTKVRFIWNQFEKKNLTGDLKRYFVEMFDGSSALLRELVTSKPMVKVDIIETGIPMLKKLVSDCENASTETERKLACKAISGFLYLMLTESNERQRPYNTQILARLFGSTDIYNCHVFGPFVPLDFTDLQVFDSSFDRYENLGKCRFPEKKTVFFNSSFSGISPMFEATLNSDLFDSNCNLDEGLRGAFDESLTNAADRFRQVRDNITRILRIGYKGGVFSGQRESGKYRRTTIIGRASIDDYLRFLVAEGVLESSKTIGQPVLIVSPDYRDSARNLIANRVLQPELDVVVRKMLHSLYGL